MGPDDESKAGCIDLSEGNSDLELKGRLLLWLSAVQKSQQLVELAFRSAQAGEQTTLSWSEKEPFPNKFELFDIKGAAVELAIIYFCQILTSGYSAQGTVSDNTEVKASHLKRIAARIPEHISSYDRFFEFCRQLLFVRNKLLAHADGAEAGMEHKPQYTGWRTPSDEWGSIDLDYWRALHEPLIAAIQELIRER